MGFFLSLKIRIEVERRLFFMASTNFNCLKWWKGHNFLCFQVNSNGKFYCLCCSHLHNANRNIRVKSLALFSVFCCQNILFSFSCKNRAKNFFSHKYFNHNAHLLENKSKKKCHGMIQWTRTLLKQSRSESLNSCSIRKKLTFSVRWMLIWFRTLETTNNNSEIMENLIEMKIKRYTEKISESEWRKHKKRIPFAREHFSIKISRDAIFDASDYSSLFDEREIMRTRVNNNTISFLEFRIKPSNTRHVCGSRQTTRGYVEKETQFKVRLHSNYTLIFGLPCGRAWLEI